MVAGSLGTPRTPHHHMTPKGGTTMLQPIERPPVEIHYVHEAGPTHVPAPVLALETLGRMHPATAITLVLTVAGMAAGTLVDIVALVATVRPTHPAAGQGRPRPPAGRTGDHTRAGGAGDRRPARRPPAARRPAVIQPGAVARPPDHPRPAGPRGDRSQQATRDGDGRATTTNGDRHLALVAPTATATIRRWSGERRVPDRVDPGHLEPGHRLRPDLPRLRPLLRPDPGRPAQGHGAGQLPDRRPTAHQRAGLRRRHPPGHPWGAASVASVAAGRQLHERPFCRGRDRDAAFRSAVFPGQTR